MSYEKSIYILSYPIFLCRNEKIETCVFKTHDSSHICPHFSYYVRTFNIFAIRFF